MRKMIEKSAIPMKHRAFQAIEEDKYNKREKKVWTKKE